MLYLSNYRGKIPIELYAKLQENYPQADTENDKDWIKRVSRDPLLARKMFSTGQFKSELTQAIHRRTMAQAGARRNGQQLPGPALVPLRPGRISDPTTTIAHRYVTDFMEPAPQNGIGALKYRYEDEARQWLLDQFDASTPVNGSIFWNGINELALARLVDRWNTTMKDQLFGQLEATTTAQYVNKQFVWDEGKQFHMFFKEASERLGAAARGHATAVVRCGLRDTSIFTHTELPRMLKLMDEQLRQRQTPAMTDLTIVVIEPKLHPERKIKAFTNNEITMIPIVKAVGGSFINGRDTCAVTDDPLRVPLRVRSYWGGRGDVKESQAATRIKADFSSLTRW